MREISFNMQNQAEIFEALKHVLKAQGKTYAELAKDIDVSEPTIKRLFSDRDCKFSRLLTICNALDLEIEDLMEIASRVEDKLQYFDRATESYFAKNQSTFFFFVMLKDGMQSNDIKQIYNLSDQDVFHYGQELERLKLATVDIAGRVLLDASNAFKINPQGPLSAVYRKITIKFVEICFKNLENSSIKIRSLSRKMLPETARMLQKQVDEIYDNIAKQARHDRLVARPEDLETIKWFTAIGPAQFKERLTIERHTNTKKAG